MGTDDVVYRSARNMGAMWARVARASGGRDERFDDAWAADASAPNPVLNRTTVLAPRAAAAELAARVDRFYGEQGEGPYGVADPWGSLDLEPSGFTRLLELPCMVRAPEPVDVPRADGLDIRRARDADTLRDFKQVLYAGFHLVPWPSLGSPLFGTRLLEDDALAMYVGYADGVPVACSAALVLDGIVGVYLVATPAEHRGRGYGEALSWRATLTEPSLPAVLQASDMGRPIYERMGYREVARIPFWMKELRTI